MLEQFKFLEKTENKVVLFRLILFFSIFVGVGMIIPIFMPISSITNYSDIRTAAGLGTMIALISLFLIYIFQSFKKSTNLLIPISTIANALISIWFIRLFGPINGTLFFFYLLVVMEAAFTLNESVIFIVGLIGIMSSLVDFVINEPVFDVKSSLLMFLRVVVIVLVSLYSTSLAKKTLKEQQQTNLLRDNYEKLKKDKEELQELDRQKVQFLNIAAHELNTPLSVIEGYLSMIVEEKNGTVDEATEKKLELVYQSSRKLAGIVKDLVDVFKIDSKKVVLEKENFDLPLFLKERIKKAHYKLSGRKIYLRFSSDIKGPVTVLADQNKLKDVVDHLIDNAIKFTETGGVEVILSEKEKIGYKVEIVDTGIGISEEKVNNLFTKFYQVEDAESPNRVPGTGLGLYIAKAYIELHGGQIGVETSPNLGSHFWFTLPK